MKRACLLACAALVAATPAVASAAPAKTTKRTITHAYQGFVGATTPAASTSLTNCPANDACWNFSSVKGEKRINLSITDDSGRPVGFQVFVDDDYEGTVQSFCGAGQLAVTPKRATAVSVRVAANSACQGLPTEGTLKAILTNR